MKPDNFYVEDLLSSLSPETTMTRYAPLFPFKEDLLRDLQSLSVVFRDDVTEDVMKALAERYDEATLRLLSRFLHLYDFDPKKLREIADLSGTESYEVLADLLRLPGVRLLRAKLYADSGITLTELAQRPTEEIQETIRRYIETNDRPEIVPFPKEIRCHKAVAQMILHLKKSPPKEDFAPSY